VVIKRRKILAQRLGLSSQNGRTAVPAVLSCDRRDACPTAMLKKGASRESSGALNYYGVTGDVPSLTYLALNFPSPSASISMGLASAKAKASTRGLA